jgi:hypothetical protein
VRIQSEGLDLWAAAHRTALEWLDANGPKGETAVWDHLKGLWCLVITLKYMF